jgi:nucleotide-binding universal stress UspA family protein
VVTVRRDWSAHLAVEHAGYFEESLQGLRREAQEVLDDQIKRIEEAGGTVAKTHFRMGQPDREIVDLAEELGLGLIVLGSRGLGGIKRALMGSVSDSVVRHAHCPVLVLRPIKDTNDRRRSSRRSLAARL